MNPITRFFSNPLVGIIGSIASVISLVVGFYFFYEGKRYPDLTFYVSPVRTTVVKSGNTSELQVLFSGKEIQGDISAAQISLWNAGKQPINTETILTPIQIVTTNQSRILDASIRNAGRAPTAISLDKSQLDKGILGVSWKILEHRDGTQIQLIYSGDPTVAFKVVGDVAEQPDHKISEQKYAGRITSAEEQISNSHETVWSKRFYQILSVAMLILVCLLAKTITIERNATEHVRILKIALIVIALTGIFCCLEIGSQIYQRFTQPWIFG